MQALYQTTRQCHFTKFSFVFLGNRELRDPKIVICAHEIILMFQIHVIVISLLNFLCVIAHRVAYVSLQVILRSYTLVGDFSYVVACIKTYTYIPQ